MCCSEGESLQDPHLLLAHEVLRGLRHDDATEAFEDLLQLCVYLHMTIRTYSIMLPPIIRRIYSHHLRDHRVNRHDQQVGSPHGCVKEKNSELENRHSLFTRELVPKYMSDKLGIG